MKRIEIEVRGGIAEVTTCPEGCEVLLTDFDDQDSDPVPSLVGADLSQRPVDPDIQPALPWWTVVALNGDGWERTRFAEAYQAATAEEAEDMAHAAHDDLEIAGTFAGQIYPTL